MCGRTLPLWLQSFVVGAGYSRTRDKVFFNIFNLDIRSGLIQGECRFEESFQEWFKKIRDGDCLMRDNSYGCLKEIIQPVISNLHTIKKLFFFFYFSALLDCLSFIDLTYSV